LYHPTFSRLPGLILTKKELLDTKEELEEELHITKESADASEQKLSVLPST